MSRSRNLTTLPLIATLIFAGAAVGARAQTGDEAGTLKGMIIPVLGAPKVLADLPDDSRTAESEAFEAVEEALDAAPLREIRSHTTEFRAAAKGAKTYADQVVRVSRTFEEITWNFTAEEQTEAMLIFREAWGDYTEVVDEDPGLTTSYKKNVKMYYALCHNEAGNEVEQVIRF